MVELLVLLASDPMSGGFEGFDEKCEPQWGLEWLGFGVLGTELEGASVTGPRLGSVLTGLSDELEVSAEEVDVCPMGYLIVVSEGTCKAPDG